MSSHRRLLVFGSYDAALHPRVAVLRDGLAARGWIVRELNAPLGATTADKVHAAGSVRAGIRMAARLGRSWSRLVRGAGAARGSGGPDVVLVGYMGHADVHLARLLFPHAVIVLDHLVGLAETVHDRGLGSGAKLQGLRAVDRSALQAADIVVVDTPEQARQLPPEGRGKAIVVPVGAGDEWFAAGRAAERSGRSGDPLRVVFFGLYTPLQGAPVIGEALGMLADDPIDVTMIGHGQELALAQAAAAANPRVDWIEWVGAADLPPLVAQHDVCLGIFGDGPKTQRVIATKVYQGMAAGCAVVTAQTPAVVRLGDGVLTVPANDPSALAQTLRGLANDPAAVGAARQRASARAQEFSPAEAVADLDGALRTASPPQSRRLPPLTLNAWLRWDVIRQVVAAADPATVLEIGPGEGAAACRLAIGRTYTGVEMSERTRTITRERLAAQGTPSRMLGSLAELATDEQFDLVCAFEVLEHIEDDEPALQSWVRRVRPGGTLLLSTPADPNRMGPHDVVAGHFRRYSAEALSTLAQRCGLVDIHTVHVGYPFGYALEAVRNRAARQHPSLTGSSTTGSATDLDYEALTEQSSSIMQPPAWAGLATQAASAPARWLQRCNPGAGTGLVLTARAPDG